MLKILNERQYRVTKAAADRFAQALEEFDQNVGVPGSQSDIHPLARSAMRESLETQWRALCEQLREYETECSNPSSVLPLTSLDDLPEILIRARISAHLSQRELAERLKLKEQQVQRWEQTQYKGVSWERMQTVLKALGVQLTGRAKRPVIGLGS